MEASNNDHIQVAWYSRRRFRLEQILVGNWLETR
jgi:hypothetical protein